MFGIQEEESAPPLTSDDVISGRFFIKQLMLSDPFFGLLAEDYIDAVNSDVSAQQCSELNIISVFKRYVASSSRRSTVHDHVCDAAATASSQMIFMHCENGVNSKGKSWAVLIVSV